jgi:hypothetical protein
MEKWDLVIINLTVIIVGSLFLVAITRYVVPIIDRWFYKRKNQ